VAPGTNRCEFCAAALLVRACPRCFARIFHGHVHCPHCGVEVGVPAQADPDGETHPRTCPACVGQPELVARLVGEVLIDECASCFGLWLDAAAVDRVVRERSEQAMAPLRELGAPAPGPGMAAPAGAVPEPTVLGAAPRPMYLKCPDCGTVMNRVNFGRRSGIIIDACRGHGTWFDDKELPRVVDFVLKGGLEQAQRLEVERLRDEARRARAEARAMQSAGGLLSAPLSPRTGEVEVFGATLSLIGRLLR
jgi:Zn-finger nucleic acid-binding protein